MNKESTHERGLRKPGRPINNRGFSGKCDVRLTAAEESMLNSLSRRNGVSRSDIMRRALADFFKFNNSEEE